MSEDWRVDSHDKEITQLRDKLREAKEEMRTEMQKELHETNDRIRVLEQRPIEWLLRAMPVIVALLLGAYIALLAAGVIHKH